MSNIGKKQLIGMMAKQSGLNKDNTEKVFNSLIYIMKNSLATGDTVSILGFGNFKPVKREARTGRNPQTGKSMKIPAKIVPKFTPGKNLKEALNK